ncbi:MAG: ATP-dependent DNA ligase, partial [Mesorhizobium sp.]
VKPGIKATVRFLRGEHKLRHATVQDFSDEGT